MPSFTAQQAELFEVVAGIRPPEGERDDMRAAGQVFRAADGQLLGKLIPSTTEAASRASQDAEGEMSAGFAAAMSQFTTAQPHYFLVAAAQYATMADFAVSTAEQYEQTQVYALVVLAQLVVSFITEMLLAIFMPEEALARLATEFAITRFLLRSAMGRLLATIVSQQVMGIALQTAIDSITQAVMILTGFQKSWNWAQTAAGIGIGSLGGAMGVVLHPAAEELSGEITATLAALTGRTELPQLSTEMVRLMVHLSSGGVHNGGHETVYGLMSGYGPQWRGDTFSGGVTQTLAGMGGRRSGHQARPIVFPASYLHGLGVSVPGPAPTILPLLNAIYHAPPVLPGRAA